MDKIDFAVATASDMGEVLALQDAVYRSEYGFVPDDGLDDRAIHFVGRLSEQGVIIATFRLVGPECRPFDFEVAVNVEGLVSPGGSAATIGRLCLDPVYRAARTSMKIHFGLLDLGSRYALSKGITDFFLITYPRLVNFYRKAGFRVCGESFDHPKWGVVSVMHSKLDIERLETSRRDTTRK